MKKILKWAGITIVVIIALAIIIPSEDKSEVSDKKTVVEEKEKVKKSKEITPDKRGRMILGPSSRVEESKEITPDVTVSAKDLAKAFEDNEINANKDYKDKTAEVTGTIDNTGEVLGATYIVLSAEKDFAITQVQCYFKDEAEINKIADMSKGQTVTVIGKIEGKAMNVDVKDCKLK